MFRFITNIKRNGPINKINAQHKISSALSACLQTQLVYEAQPVFALFVPRSRYECSQQSGLYFRIFSPISAALPAHTHTHCTHGGCHSFLPWHLAVADSGASSALRRSALIPIVRLDLPRHHLSPLKWLCRALAQFIPVQ